ncbi:MAG: sugar phosphate isomerase/epimerase [Clostridia bacterium]|nr:sugar phosphate isomerase/epimerase [Clostridia bacterium]
MKLATTTGDFATYTDTQFDALQYIHDAGFRCADYSFGMDYKNRTGVFAPDWLDYIDRLKAHADALGMTFVQSHAPMGMPYGMPLARKSMLPQFIEDNKRCIEACALLGIPSVVVHSGYRRGLSREENIAENKAFYLELLHFAEDFGVEVLTENFNKMSVEGVYWIDNAPDLLALLDAVDHPLFHVCWDIGHANMQDMPQDEALRLLGPHVRALHIQDNMGQQDTHTAPFFGSVSMDAVMHGLLDIGYKGAFTFEANGILSGPAVRRPFEKDDRLQRAPLGLRIEAEKFMYQIGRYVLDAYGLLEE